ncbi:hypothetical protein W823_12730 [Williamsia sp. D3]|nr:hypothetical protein W823_12730 [Williamsia sp. D3]
MEGDDEFGVASGELIVYAGPQFAGDVGGHTDIESGGEIGGGEFDEPWDGVESFDQIARCGNRAWPAAVRSTWWWARTKSAVPRLFSRYLIRWLSGDAAMCSRCAARAKVPSSATATK